jgi:anti-anti-sigma factor
VPLVLSGEVDLSTAEQITDATEKRPHTERPAEVLIDLAAVTFLDSTGMRHC